MTSHIIDQVLHMSWVQVGWSCEHKCELHFFFFTSLKRETEILNATFIIFATSFMYPILGHFYLPPITIDQKHENGENVILWYVPQNSDNEDHLSWKFHPLPRSCVVALCLFGTKLQSYIYIYIYFFFLVDKTIH